MEVALRVTGPQDEESPEELSAIGRRLWRKQFVQFLIYVLVLLGVVLAAIAVFKR
jgi:hypothetical protein